MEARYERLAQQLQGELTALVKEQDSWVRKAERVTSDLGGTPRLRDRNPFFNSLLNGDLATLDRIRPLWREAKRCSREAGRHEGLVAAKTAEIKAAVRRGLEAGDSGYQALRVKVKKETSSKRSCNQLLNAIRSVRRRMDQTAKSPRNEESGSSVDRAAKEVSAQLRVVCRLAVSLDEKVPGGSLNGNDVMRIDAEFPAGGAGDKASRRKQDEVRSALGSLERKVESLLRNSTVREKFAQEDLRRYVERECARFTDTAE